MIALSACGKGDTPPSEPGPAPMPAPRALPPPPADELATLTLTTLPATTATDPVPAGPLVVASATAIVADGRALASVTAGRIDPAVIDKADDRVVPLGPWADAATAGLAPNLPVRIAADPTLSAVALMQVLTGVHGRMMFSLVVRTPDGVRALPVRVRTNPTAGSLAIAHDDDRSAAQVIEAIVQARRDAVPVELVWSLKSLAEQRRERDEAARAEQRRADESVALQEEAARFADILSASDQDYHVGDMARRTQPGADLATQLDEVARSGGGVMIGGGGGGGVRVGGGGAAGGPTGAGDPRTGVATGSLTVPGSGSAAPSGPTGRIAMAGGQEVEDTSLTLALVKQKLMAAYMSGLKRCYKQALAVDPDLHGALTLRLSVDETGRVADGRATAPTAELTDCVTGLTRNWRFPVPLDADGEPTAAAFQLELQLTPE